MDVWQSVWLTWNDAPVRVQARPWEGWEMHPMWGMWGAWGFGMMLMMLVFWVLVITGLVLSIRWLTRQALNGGEHSTLKSDGKTEDRFRAGGRRRSSSTS